VNHPGEDSKSGKGCRRSEVADRPARRRAERTDGYTIDRTLSCTEVAALLGVSVQAAFRLEQKALRKIADLLGSDPRKERERE